jgi:hypothetical protein
MFIYIYPIYPHSIQLLSSFIALTSPSNGNHQPTNKATNMFDTELGEQSLSLMIKAG